MKFSRSGLVLTSVSVFLVNSSLPTVVHAQGGMAGMPGMAGMTSPKSAKADTAKQSMMTTPLDISMERMGSGTTWIPEAAPLPTSYGRLGGWDISGHGFAFGQYISEGGRRGEQQFGSLNWGMLMANHPLAGGMIQLRSMLSLDVLGVGRGGYPLLLQSGESFEGQPLHDRQHPHDVWMELSALYLRAISKSVGIQLYAAPSGEPALGPVAFMHRPSAMDNLAAGIGHHWQDATHISFGVATVGLFTHNLKIEGSLFNGREPDDKRWDFDFGKLDSYSGRVTFNPSPRLSATAGYGHLILGGESMKRFVASVLHGMPLGHEGQLAAALIYGTNQESGTTGWSQSILLESEAVLDARNSVFARIENAQKSATDLVLADSAEGFTSDRLFKVSALSVGYVREITHSNGATLGLGIKGSINLVPETLEHFYGSRHPMGFTVFLRLRPERKAMEMPGMPGMQQ